jgi:beta-aspartyl-peptidase (threonine type)
MGKIAIVVHGGAGPDSKYIAQNQKQYKEGLEQACAAGYLVLEQGGSAIDAVETAVTSLENNPLFNAGRGSALNAEGNVEMCASIMDGIDKRCGAVTLVTDVRNPVQLARTIMEKCEHNFLGGPAGSKYAKENGLAIAEPGYFRTEHQIEVFHETMEQPDEDKVESYGTVGAVACDRYGNLAAATSTGGTEAKMPGRIGDTPLVGAGVYADNKTCAISCTGEGDDIIRYTIAHDVAAVIEYREMPLLQAAEYVLNEKLKDVSADIGLIGINADAEICMLFNSDRMHRAWRTSDGDHGATIYKG